jgi:hypothetical protein
MRRVAWPRLIFGSWANGQSLAYGQCIGKSYQEVQKGMCENEFKAFKECVQVSDYISFVPMRRRGRGLGAKALISEIIRKEMVNQESTVVQYHHTMHSI